MKTRLIEGSGTSEETWAADGRLDALPEVTLRDLVPEAARCVIVAPHPDDEILPCGGLLAALAARGAEVLIVAVTDGERSHRAESRWTAELLRAARPAETLRALKHLGLDGGEILRLGLPDGAVTGDALAAALRGATRPGDVIFTTWSLDGHPDHEATANGVAEAAPRAGAQVIEMPIWGWHWAEPDDWRLPWKSMVKFPLTEKFLDQKKRALAEFASQLAPDPETGREAILPPAVLRRFTRKWETFFLP